ncbi:hypothetical protein [Bradyrhizobium cenepequi]|uniref:hypothetical protein n=1 Tax=Bradyrhizobium cenepequi TaxID=2821403 RepID=UPI001CE270EE|nr:hypothetical protein [Bradyrhizobium cenepequi]MCA6108568.1 hypothetical protein [Bradyrhizobium cenepequi]
MAFEFIDAPLGIDASDRIRLLPRMSEYAAFIQPQFGRGWSIGLAPWPITKPIAPRATTNTESMGHSAAPDLHCHSADARVGPDRVTGLLVDNTAGAWFAAIGE